MAKSTSLEIVDIDHVRPQSADDVDKTGPCACRRTRFRKTGNDVETLLDIMGGLSSCHCHCVTGSSESFGGVGNVTADTAVPPKVLCGEENAKGLASRGRSRDQRLGSGKRCLGLRT